MTRTIAILTSSDFMLLFLNGAPSGQSQAGRREPEETWNQKAPCDKCFVSSCGRFRQDGRICPSADESPGQSPRGPLVGPLLGAGAPKGGRGQLPRPPFPP